MYDIITCWDPASLECVGSDGGLSPDLSYHNSAGSTVCTCE